MSSQEDECQCSNHQFLSRSFKPNKSSNQLLAKSSTFNESSKKFADYVYKSIPFIYNKLDVIIFGASGFVGQYTVLEAVNILKQHRWGIAGRNHEKLEQVLNEIGTKTRTDLSDVEIIIANISDDRSLKTMVEKCKVLVNCSGPCGVLGEPIIKACLENSTHYVDVSCEPYFVELMQLKYHQEAEERGVYIVCACGFQTFPIDIGVHYMRQNFNGTINIVEAYSEYWRTAKNMITPIASNRAFLSIILACSNLDKIADVRTRFHYKDFPELKPLAVYKGPIHDSKLVGRHCVPFPMIAQQVVECSQYYFFEEESKRPIQFLHYISFPKSVLALIFFIWCFVIALLAQFRITRSIIRRFPRIFTFNLFSNDGPDRKCNEKTCFRITFRAVGWSEKMKVSSNYPLEKALNKEMIAQVVGVNPIYGVTCVSLLVSALTILRETENLPSNGGVYSPAAAFGHTSLIEELEKHEHGLHFNIIRL